MSGGCGHVCVYASSIHRNANTNLHQLVKVMDDRHTIFEMFN